MLNHFKKRLASYESLIKKETQWKKAMSTNKNSSTIQQSVTYRYRTFPVPGIYHFFGGIGTDIATNWYRKKVSEPVSEKFGTGKQFLNRYRKNLVPELIFVAQILEL